jgi:hypothetical protein
MKYKIVRNRGSPKKIFKKRVDKLHKICYNKYVIKRDYKAITKIKIEKEID